MSDVKLNWFDFGADIEISNGDITQDNGLATAVLISLFSDQRAPDESLLPDGETNKRGWWGDLDIDKTGSLLWLINREKMLPEVAQKAKEYCESALQWLIDENICSTVTVISTLIRPQSLQIKIKLNKGAATQYSYLWDAVKLYEINTIQNTSIIIEFND